MKIQIGDVASDFTTTATSGPGNYRPFKLSEELKKKPALLVFYPGDFTAVCTKQLCDYRDNWERLKGFDVQIVGVSTNDKASHDKFISTYKLPFELLDDSEKKICASLDMIMIGGMAKRGFILIDKDMKIKYIYTEFLPFFKRSAEEVADILRKYLPKK